MGTRREKLNIHNNATFIFTDKSPGARGGSGHCLKGRTVFQRTRTSDVPQPHASFSWTLPCVSSLSLLSLSAQLLYPSSPQLIYQLPGPDQSPRAVRARKRRQQRTAESQRGVPHWGVRREKHTPSRPPIRRSVLLYPSRPKRLAHGLIPASSCSCSGKPERREAGCAMGQACGHALLCRSQPPSSEM